MFAINKNSYLQSKCTYINPRILNRCIDRAREVPALDEFDVEPLFLRVTSEQPNIPVDNVDVTRQPVGFGSWAMPKLRRELHDEDPDVVIKALNSICDLVHDPERAYEAINLQIPDRLADLLLEPLSPIRERAVLALSIIAELADGKEAIVKNSVILENLNLCLTDNQPSVRLKTAACFEMIARSWMAADVLVEMGLVSTLINLLSEEVEATVDYHLETLKSLMYDCGKYAALKEDGFKIFLSLLKHPSLNIICKALDCLTILVSTKWGKILAIEKNLLKELNPLLYSRDIPVCTSAASLLMFCTIKTKAKVLAADIKDLPKQLIKLCTCPLNTNLQMFCLKALTNICEHPLIRKEVNEHHLESIKNMQVGSNAVYKRTLLQVLSWVPNELGTNMTDSVYK